MAFAIFSSFLQEKVIKSLNFFGFCGIISV
nr:MAG TPA: hypothetical protein [Caudoviricetes sp.]